MSTRRKTSIIVSSDVSQFHSVVHMDESAERISLDGQLLKFCFLPTIKFALAIFSSPALAWQKLDVFQLANIGYRSVTRLWIIRRECGHACGANAHVVCVTCNRNGDKTTTLGSWRNCPVSLRAANVIGLHRNRG